MTANKKYSYQLSQDSESGQWRAEISRRATAKRTVVSKAQEGFASEAQAKEWAEATLLEFIAINERNKRKTKAP